MQRTPFPVTKELVLLGGGHAHVAVLKSFAMQPLPGVSITLISKGAETAYSGMLPGLIAGHYTFDEAHIPLRPLCRFAQARYCQTAVTGLDLATKLILCEGRPPLRFDLLSIDIGSTPGAHGVPGAAKNVLPVKPVERFLRQWDQLGQQLERAAAGAFHIAVVGGGAGGVELTLATQYRLRTQLKGRAGSQVQIEYDLVTDSPVVLPTHNRRVQAKFARILQERGVRVHLNQRVTEVTPGLLRCESGQAIPFHAAFWVTTACAPPWLAEAGLATDAGGFIAVNDCLQSVSHPFVFAAGDVAAVLNHPRPKSGVFAVRQGLPLASNLRLALVGHAPEPFTPQRKFLGLISTGDKYAIASRGAWAVEGRWVWKWKDWIDRRWMRQYQQLPQMQPSLGAIPPGARPDDETLAHLSSSAPRCGGCGSKIGSTVLSNVLKRLKPVPREDVLVGLAAPDDAAVLRVPAGRVSVQTVDFFRAFINDPYLFGRVAANHCLGDIFAMGAEPQSALAIAVVPYASEAIMEEQLFQVMAGAEEILRQHQTALSGGHSAEGPELAFGLTVSGLADPARLLRKSGMQPGDQLILTKPLGTGVLFAAEMRGQAKGAWIESALAWMQASNQSAARCFSAHAATACTDVTGFGLMGHLVEMAQASLRRVELSAASVPLMEGVLPSMRAGIFSSLQPQNLRLRRAIANLEEVSGRDWFPALFDPQTAGGLLASVPAERAQECLSSLRESGCSAAAIIGSIQAGPEATHPIRIV